MVLCVCVGYDVYFAGHSEAVPPCHPAAGTIGLSFANFRRFWAVAARVNSSWTPHGPRNRSRPSPRMRLRCANSISTFLRRPCAFGLNSDAVHWRAKSLTISYFSRWTARASELGQHFSFSSHPVQSDFSARYFRAFQLGAFRAGSE